MKEAESGQTRACKQILRLVALATALRMTPSASFGFVGERQEGGAGGADDIEQGVAVADAELGEDVGEVKLDRGFADAQGLGDFLVGEAALNELDDAALPGGENIGPTVAAGEVDGGADVLLQHLRRHPVMTLKNGAQSRDEVGLHFGVGQEALDSKKEQAAEFVAGKRMVEKKKARFGVAKAEETEKLAQGERKSSLVEHEGVDAVTGKSPRFELRVEYRDADRGLVREDLLQVAGRERVVFDDTDGERDFFFVNSRKHDCGVNEG